jgi:hypothetical protein
MIAFVKIFIFFIICKEAMQLQLTNFLTEIGLLGTFGIGFLVLKNKPSLAHKDYENFENIHQTALPSMLDSFRNLSQDREFEKLCNMIEDFLDDCNKISQKIKVDGGKFMLNRRYEDISKHCQVIVRQAMSSPDPEIVTSAIDCERDQIGYLTGYCENVLRNLLLDT